MIYYFSNAPINLDLVLLMILRPWKLRHKSPFTNFIDPCNIGKEENLMGQNLPSKMDYDTETKYAYTPN